MIRHIIRNWQGLMVLVTLVSLGIALPHVHAEEKPPHQIFAQLAAGTPDPVISVEARQNDRGGWVLDIAASNFNFTEICKTVADARPVGHAHVSTGDVKIASAFQPWFVLGKLEPGKHTFRIVLRAQDHRVLVGQKGMIAAEVTIDVPAGEEV